MDPKKRAQRDAWDRELADFKCAVNLVEYAKSLGYEVQRDKSSRSCKVLDHPGTGHKIVVGIDIQDEHWTYYTLGSKEDRDYGSVVDFVQHRGTRNTTLGDVRRELRKWLGRPDPAPLHPDSRPVPSQTDRIAAAHRYYSARVVDNSRYLNERGLLPATLQDPRFRDSWREDERGNVLFVHRDAYGVSGYEIKNRGFVGFSKHGLKTVWHSTPRADDRRLVIAESAIDALSYHQLHPETLTRYMSLGGHPSPEQVGLLERAAAKLAAPSEIVLALDADAAGDALYELVANRLSRLTGCVVRRHSPGVAGCKDWNDVLRLRISSEH